MKFFVPLTIFVLLFNQKTTAQNHDYAIAQSRQYAHYSFDKIKQRVLPTAKEEGLNAMLTQSLHTQLDTIQQQIELDTATSNNKKITYLRGLGETLEGAENIYKHLPNNVRLVVLPQIVTAWYNVYLLDKNDASIALLMKSYPYNVCNLLLKTVSFNENPDIADCRNELTLKHIQPNDPNAVNILNVNADLPFSDSIINIIARKEPDILYTYAQASNSKLGKRLQNNPDTAVKLLYRLANNGNGQLYFPFYDDLLSGKTTVEAIKKETQEDAGYYSLLVKTAIEYAGRAAHGDTPTAWNRLREMLHTKAYLLYVNAINGLHESGDAVRFRSIQNLSAEELYYLIISCETEIYTSSYIYVYNRLWQRMQKPNANALLALVNSDRYKKFIAMAANYNTLEDFLKRMSKENATALMTGFVDNLDKGKDSNLEDAVDVANSYASITNDSLRNLMMDEVRVNYHNALASSNKRGQVIYRLEQLILSSSDTTSGINISDSLGILPIFKMPNKMLTDKYDRVILRMFFYNDKSVMSMFNAFIGGFNRTNWKIASNKNWVTVNSIKGKSVTIYANKASAKEDFSDAANQRALNSYMEINKLYPTITIHRGHSYTADLTIKQMSPTSKIVFLGSCGGYHQMDEILSISPDAQVIATKQIGKTAINQPFFSLLTETLRNGNDIDWIPFWKQFGKNAHNEGFDDYIPPYKNLGAIFIKAYKKAEGE